MDFDPLSLYDSYRLDDPNVINIRTETHLIRGAYAIRAVERTFDPEYNSIFEVGVGAKGYVLVCPYEPYCIAAALGEARYDMTIVEPNYYVVEDLFRRRNIYHIPLEDRDKKEDDQVWDQYLSLIGGGRVVEYAEDDLIFPYWIKDSDIDRFNESGIFAAPIPASFLEGLENGGISIVNQRVENFDWNTIPDQSLTLGVIQNALNLLKESDQRLVLMNLREKLTPGGKVLMTGFRIIFPSMDFAFKGNYGGWIDEQSLANIGLQVLPGDKWIDHDSYGMWFLSRL